MHVNTVIRILTTDCDSIASLAYLYDILSVDFIVGASYGKVLTVPPLSVRVLCPGCSQYRHP